MGHLSPWSVLSEYPHYSRFGRLGTRINLSGKRNLSVLVGPRLLLVGGKKGNRTEPTDYTGRSLREFPIVAVLGFTSVTEPNQLMRHVLPISLLFLLVFYQTIYLISYILLISVYM